MQEYKIEKILTERREKNQKVYEKELSLRVKHFVSERVKVTN